MIVKIRDVHYHVEMIGVGEPIVFLHGFTGCTENWKEVIAKLDGRFQCILIDIIGHGKTDSPINQDDYRFLQVRDDVILLLEELSVGMTNLVGYSMGGRLALSLALDFPTRFNRVVLESSSPGLETVSERMTRQKSDEELANKIMKEGIESFVDYWENIPLFASQKQLSKEKQKYLHKQRSQNNPVGLANSLRGMGTGSQPSYWGRLSDMINPTLLICGELDQKFCRIAEKMTKSMKHSVVKKINVAGHAIHMEQPEKFGKIISVFLQG